MTHTVRAVTPADLPALFTYLGEQLTENGRNGNPLFQPVPRTDDAAVPLAIRNRFNDGLATAVGEPGWRRAWIAVDGRDAIAGHIDLRARPEPGSTHRAILGMGVHSGSRRVGLGTRLINVAASWSLDNDFAWIDLEVLSVNTPAIALYQHLGFAVIGEFADMYRIDGERHAYTLMSLQILP